MMIILHWKSCFDGFPSPLLISEILRMQYEKYEYEIILFSLSLYHFKLANFLFVSNNGRKIVLNKKEENDYHHSFSLFNTKRAEFSVLLYLQCISCAYVYFVSQCVICALFVQNHKSQKLNNSWAIWGCCWNRWKMKKKIKIIEKYHQIAFVEFFALVESSLLNCHFSP